MRLPAVVPGPGEKGNKRPDKPASEGSSMALTLTTIYGHMTYYVSRTVLSIRREDPHANPSRPQIARGELCQGTREGPGCFSEWSPTGAQRAGGRWDRFGQKRRADPAFQAQSPLLCLCGSPPLPNAPRGAGNRPEEAHRNLATQAKTHRQAAVKLSRRSGLADVARAVAQALGSARIHAVLTGGACASLYSRGYYQSSDLDFIIQSGASSVELDTAMASIGFRRVGNQYEHPAARFFVEFPAGPLGIGSDLRIQPVAYKIKGTTVSALSPTDSCRDRLAAFYHWNDRQALRVAVTIARRHPVNINAIRRWSRREVCSEKLSEFLRAVAQGKRRRRKRKTPKSPRHSSPRSRRLTR